MEFNTLYIYLPSPAGNSLKPALNGRCSKLPFLKENLVLNYTVNMPVLSVLNISVI